MIRIAAVIMGAILLPCAPCLLAQHGGHGGGGRRGATGAGSGSTSDAGLTDFNHALAVQATPDQLSHFPGLIKNTESAQKLAQDLSRWSRKADSAPALSQKSAALKGAVAEAQGSNQDFMKSFTKSQKSGLKELTRKLEKADSEVAKQWKYLQKLLDGANPDAEGIAGTADKLGKALEELKGQQTSLGTEMGIQAQSPSGA